MPSTVELLSEKVGKIVKDGDNLSDISKEDFRNYIGITLSGLKGINESFDELDDDDAKGLRILIQDNSRNRNAMNLMIYTTFSNRLCESAKKDERTRAFSSLKQTAIGYTHILNEIDRNIDTLFENKTISIYNTKLSHVAILGVIKNASDLYDFSWFLFNGVCYDIGMGIEKPARYRFVFMNSVKEKIADIVNGIYTRVGDGAIFNEVMKLRKENKDTLLINDENKPNETVVASVALNRDIGKSIQAGFMSLNIFRWIGEAWNTFRDNHFRSIEDKRDWMQTHVQLLRLKLQGLDENDREYQRLKKIIGNYDNMVSAADEKIKNYREE